MQLQAMELPHPNINNSMVVACHDHNDVSKNLGFASKHHYDSQPTVSKSNSYSQQKYQRGAKAMQAEVINQHRLSTERQHNPMM